MPSSVVLSVGDREIEIENDIVIVQVGGLPPYDLLKKAGVAFGGDSLTVGEADQKCSRLVQR